MTTSVKLPRCVLDHAVVDVRDTIDTAASIYRRLGFHLTERGRHTLGSSNHLAILGTNYLELLGWEKGTTNRRPLLARFPIGLNALVFRSDDARGTFRALDEAGLRPEEPVDFSRPVEFAGGLHDARFRTVQLPAETLHGARTYFCQHFTPELVWPERSQAHPNSAFDIIRIAMIAEEPHRVGAVFSTMFGAAAVQFSPAACTLYASPARVDVRTRAALEDDLGGALPNPDNRDETLAVITFAVRNLRTAAAALASGHIATAIARAGDRIVVPAAQCLNVTLEFVDAGAGCVRPTLPMPM